MKTKLLRKLRKQYKITFDGKRYRLYTKIDRLNYNFWKCVVVSSKIKPCIQEYLLLLQNEVNGIKFKEKQIFP
jgi:cytidylate kinase